MPVWCRMSRCDDCTPDQLCDNCATHFRCDFCGGHDRWHRCPAPGEQAVIERGALPTTHSDFSTPQEALPTTDLPTSFRRERGARRLGAPISRRMLNSPVPFVLPRSRTYSTSENFTESDERNQSPGGGLLSQGRHLRSNNFRTIRARSSTWSARRPCRVICSPN